MNLVKIKYSTYQKIFIPLSLIFMIFGCVIRINSNDFLTPLFFSLIPLCVIPISPFFGYQFEFPEIIIYPKQGYYISQNKQIVKMRYDKLGIELDTGINLFFDAHKKYIKTGLLVLTEKDSYFFLNREDGEIPNSENIMTYIVNQKLVKWNVNNGYYM